MDNNLLSDLIITLPQECSFVFSISNFQFLMPIYSRLSKRAEVIFTVDSIAVVMFGTLKN